jgi:hypothetical protein
MGRSKGLGCAAEATRASLHVPASDEAVIGDSPISSSSAEASQTLAIVREATESLVGPSDSRCSPLPWLPSWRGTAGTMAPRSSGSCAPLTSSLPSTSAIAPTSTNAVDGSL